MFGNGGKTGISGFGPVIVKQRDPHRVSWYVP